MTVSLVSAPVLGFDLVRHPHGDALARVLLIGLGLRGDDLVFFSDSNAGGWSSYRNSTVTAGESVRPLTSLRPVEQTRSPATSVMTPTQRLSAAERLAETDEHGYDEAVKALQNLMILDIDVIERLIRQDVLGWCTAGSIYPHGETLQRQGGPAGDAIAHSVAETLVDAAAAEWVMDLPSALCKKLRSPLATITTNLPRHAPEVGPCHDKVYQIIYELQTLTGADRNALQEAAVRSAADNMTWASAMHDCSWAIMTTSRVHAAAAAQLLAVRAFIASGLTAADAASGMWNIVSGCIHAAVVSDVLPEATAASLTTVWRQLIDR